jgi:hypothetical protein
MGEFYITNAELSDYGGEQAIARALLDKGAESIRIEVAREPSEGGWSYKSKVTNGIITIEPFREFTTALKVAVKEGWIWELTEDCEYDGYVFKEQPKEK